MQIKYSEASLSWEDKVIESKSKTKFGQSSIDIHMHTGQQSGLYLGCRFSGGLVTAQKHASLEGWGWGHVPSQDNFGF